MRIEPVFKDGKIVNKLVEGFHGVSVGVEPPRSLFIGQTVHYYDHYHHQRAAIITAIHQDKSTCDLCVLYPTRMDFVQGIKHDADHEKESWDFIQ